MKNICIAAVLAVAGGAEAVLTEANLCDVRLKGYVDERLESCIANHVLKTDATYLSRVFAYQEDVGNWQTEFWGKYMHSAVPFWQYTQDAALKARVAKSVKDICSYQLPDGYIGNYAAGKRSDKGWDVWGNKYTLLGLLHWYSATGDTEALAAARRLVDYLMTQFGPGKRPLHLTGAWRGLPSGSVLEPVVWLYRATKEQKYLDFAAWIVEDMDKPETSAHLIRDAHVPVGERVNDGPGATKSWGGRARWSSRKAYEMMSCYQGLLDFYEVTGRKDCLEAAVSTARSIAETEVNIAGGSSASENWYGGAKKQTHTTIYEQETCVLTTWLRLCEKLLTATGDPHWADELEKCFYNAYLASLRFDGGYFLQYDPLTGSRHAGEDHCRLHTNCCNANGPRGFLAFLKSFLMADGNTVYLNFFSSGTATIALADGDKVTLEGYTWYPKFGDIHFRNRSAKAKTFTLKVRIPAWSTTTRVQVNGTDVPAKAGEYLAITREWKPGDHLDVNLDITSRAHVQDGYVAFTAGPIVLARDARFQDGSFDEVISNAANPANLKLRPIRTESNEMWITYAGDFPMGVHAKNPNERLPHIVKFCDYASAGDTWTPESAFRVWLPIVRGLAEFQ